MDSIVESERWVNVFSSSSEPSPTSNISCPQAGLYKSSNTYQPSLPASTCSTGLWTLSIGCETTNQSELTFSSTCRHDTVPDVQVITSIKGLCLASWRTDRRFQRTLIVYEQTRAFCLVRSQKHPLTKLPFLCCLDSTSQINDRQLDPLGIELYKHWSLIDLCRE